MNTDDKCLFSLKCYKTFILLTFYKQQIVMDGGDGIFDNVTIKLSEGKMALDSNSNSDLLV